MIAKAHSRVTVFALMLLMSGCSGVVRQPAYYSLALAPKSEVMPIHPQRSVSVAVRQFESPAYLRQGRIVYREQPDQVGFYEYHRWAADPGMMITTAVVSRLQSTQILSLVSPRDNPHSADYLVTGRLEKLDEIDYGDGVSVEATLSAALIDLHTGAVLWAGHATHTSKVDQRSVYSVVSQMNDDLDICLDQLTSNIEHAIENRDEAARLAHLK